jgi:L-lactate dehydrogenase
MKVTIIGGGGLVGSCAAFALQTGGVVRQIALLDANAEAAAGQALDLLHGSSVAADQIICAGGYEHVADSDCICITAGMRRKPDESRLDLINRNVALFLGILAEIRKVGHRPDAVVLVVSNPVDVLTQLAAQKLDMPPGQVIGLGTVLDSIRFCSLIAAKLGVPPTQVSALVLGEHGDSMVPVWSGATVAGLPVDKFPGWSPMIAGEIVTQTRTAGAEVIKRKGGAGFAVGLAIREVVHALARNGGRILPVSSVQSGAFDIRGAALSLPTLLGRQGVQAVRAIELWPKEIQALRTSANVIAQTVATVLKGR